MNAMMASVGAEAGVAGRATPGGARETACRVAASLAAGLVAVVIAPAFTRAGAGAPAPAACKPRDGAGACKTACDAGSRESCAVLGVMHLRGEVDGGGDPRAAERLLRGACSAKVALGCGGLGSLYMARKDQRRGRPLLEKGCAMGDALSCESLGGMALGFDGATPASPDIRVSTRVAVVHYRKACALGSGAGCAWVGAAIVDHAVVGTAAEALDLCMKACNLGVGASCRQALELLTDDTPESRALAAPLDMPNLSASLLERGCKLGDAKSCARKAPK